MLMLVLLTELCLCRATTQPRNQFQCRYEGGGSDQTCVTAATAIAACGRGSTKTYMFLIINCARVLRTAVDLAAAATALE